MSSTQYLGIAMLLAIHATMFYIGVKKLGWREAINWFASTMLLGVIVVVAVLLAVGAI